MNPIIGGEHISKIILVNLNIRASG